MSFSYVKAVPLIRNFTLHVQPGQRVAIVGPTGCGKTTLINLLMRFYDVDSGRICVDGVPVRSMRRSALRGLYGMVLQETWLKNATVRENIAYGRPGASFEEVQARQRRRGRTALSSACRTGTTPSLRRRGQSFGRAKAAFVHRAHHAVPARTC